MRGFILGALGVHVTQDGSGFEELDLLMLRNQQFGSDGPGRIMFPSMNQISHNSKTQAGEERKEAYRCLVKQLLCLYPFPHVSHRRSDGDFLVSPLMRYEPSLALLLRFLVSFLEEDFSSSSTELSSKASLSCAEGEWEEPLKNECILGRALKE